MNRPPDHLDPISWIALVARWVEVARASRAIAGGHPRLRDSIAPLIAIEANTAALHELARIAESDRAHARALAELSIRSAAGELDRLWRGEEWPEELHAACAAAERALRHAVYAGLQELVVTGDAPFEVPEWSGIPTDTHGGESDGGRGGTAGDDTSQRGTLAVMQPGTIAMPGEPVAWWCGRPAPHIDEAAPLERRTATEPLQVYRELDGRGRFVADRIASIEDDLTAGLPLLTPILLDGVRIGRFLQPRDTWLAMQRAALEGRATLPVHR